MKHILSLLAVAACALLVSPLHATVNTVVNTVTIAATALQESGSTTALNVTKTPAPVKLSVTTKSIMTAAANSAAVILPIGAKLAAVQTFGSTPTYYILSKTNVILVTISGNFMNSGRVNLTTSNIQNAPNNLLIHSGAFSTVTNLAFPSQTNYEYYVFNYNDGGVRFSMTGQMTHTRSDTKPSIATGIYNESQTNKSNVMSGTGLIGGATGFEISGTLAFSGTSAQQL